jgi:hypothetical protein
MVRHVNITVLARAISAQGTINAILNAKDVLRSREISRWGLHIVIASFC